MDVLGIGPHDTWMVGDNLEWEVVALQRLGIHAIWHDGYGVGLPAGSPIRPDRIIRRLSELLLEPSQWTCGVIWDLGQLFSDLVRIGRNKPSISNVFDDICDAV